MLKKCFYAALDTDLMPLQKLLDCENLLYSPDSGINKLISIAKRNKAMK